MMFKDIKINLKDNYKYYMMGSGAVIALGLIMFILMGFNLGIDFRGGTNIQVAFEAPVEISAINKTIESFDLNQDIVYVGDGRDEVLIRTVKDLSTEERAGLFSALSSELGAKSDTSNSVTQRSATIGSETMGKAIKAIVIAAIGMLIYITFRFEWKFGVAAVIALIHDVLILLAIYAIFRIPMNQPFIAAVLTVVGYSINDTIVVFDRIRDNIKGSRSRDYFKLSETSINQTITRSINTSLTTLLVIGALFVFGTSAIKDIALPLLGGVLAGTYSSVFIASPVWVLLKEAIDKKK